MLASLNAAFRSDDICLHANASHGAFPTCLSPLSLKRPGISECALIVVFVQHLSLSPPWIWKYLKSRCGHDEECRFGKWMGDVTFSPCTCPLSQVRCQQRVACRRSESPLRFILLVVLTTKTHFTISRCLCALHTRCCAQSLLTCDACMKRRLIRAQTTHVPTKRQSTLREIGAVKQRSSYILTKSIEATDCLIMTF
jgi:hypothetical protein